MSRNKYNNSSILSRDDELFEAIGFLTQTRWADLLDNDQVEYTPPTRHAWHRDPHPSTIKDDDDDGDDGDGSWIAVKTKKHQAKPQAKPQSRPQAKHQARPHRTRIPKKNQQ
jgi:hypothetical protein